MQGYEGWRSSEFGAGKNPSPGKEALSAGR